jgi:hypothetical protein
VVSLAVLLEELVLLLEPVSAKAFLSRHSTGNFIKDKHPE